jgi:hypothetical protein
MRKILNYDKMLVTEAFFNSFAQMSNFTLLMKTSTLRGFQNLEGKMPIAVFS